MLFALLMLLMFSTREGHRHARNFTQEKTVRIQDVLVVRGCCYDAGASVGICGDGRYISYGKAVNGRRYCGLPSVPTAGLKGFFFFAPPLFRFFALPAIPFRPPSNCRFVPLSEGTELQGPVEGGAAWPTFPLFVLVSGARRYF